MQLIDARDAARLKNIQALYLAAFPAAERKPFSMILKKQAEGSVDILSIEEDDGRFLGLAILAHAGDLSLLDYFAVSPESRGKGTGGAAFELLKARHANRRFFLEIEDVSVPSDNAEQRLRRRAFYLRHGMRPLSFKAELFGVRMEVLSAGAEVSFEEYHSLYTSVFGAVGKNRIRLAAPCAE